MHPRQPLPPSLLDLAALQARVVTREQLLGHGVNRSVPDRMVAAGHWRRLARGVVYTLPVEPTWTALAWAGVLIGGDHARLGGRAAGHVQGLVAEAPTDITVMVPAGGAPTVVGCWTFRRERAGVRAPSRRGSPPRTAVEDTILDLAAESDERDVIDWVTCAVRERLTTPARIRRAVERRRTVGHRKLLLRLVGEVAAGVQSPLEHDYLRNVERAHGLPTGRRQVRQGRTFADIWYEAYGLIVELDGLLGHVGTGGFRDLARDNVSTGAGLATLRYGHRDVNARPCEVARQVGHNLTIRGWLGVLQRCRWCRAVA